ncbi:MAG: hypothetical protein ABH883_03290 [Candidatus Omnitrophota bacterium]
MVKTRQGKDAAIRHVLIRHKSSLVLPSVRTTEYAPARAVRADNNVKEREPGRKKKYYG